MTKIISWILYLVVKTLLSTCKVRFLTENNEDHYLYALWHQNLIAGLGSEMGTPHCMVVSSSKDGQLVATACTLFGHKPIRGSSNRGGPSAIKGMIRELKKTPGCITIDGPKGPVYQAKKGIFELALLTSQPIIPLIAIPSRYWSFSKSWDNFRVPKPFSTILVWHGEKLRVTKKDKENNFEQLSKKLEKLMLEAENKFFH